MTSYLNRPYRRQKTQPRHFKQRIPGVSAKIVLHHIPFHLQFRLRYTLSGQLSISEMTHQSGTSKIIHSNYQIITTAEELIDYVQTRIQIQSNQYLATINTTDTQLSQIISQPNELDQASRWDIKQFVASHIEIPEKYILGTWGFTSHSNQTKQTILEFHDHTKAHHVTVPITLDAHKTNSITINNTVNVTTPNLFKSTIQTIINNTL